MYPNKGRWALVTGGASGIGYTICERLAESGAAIVVVDLDEAGATKAADNLQSQGYTAFGEGCDVSRLNSVDETFERLHSLGREPDILVNCAGINMPAMPVERLDFKLAWNLIHVHLGGTMNCSSRAIPRMRERKYGRIVNISSRSGVYGTTGQTAYSAAKAGVIGFSKALAKEVISTGICVNVVAPGWITTPASDSLLSKIPKDKQGMLMRGSPGDIASMVNYLCLPEAGFIHGQVILEDGGDSLRYSLDYIFGLAIDEERTG